jgi:hypothetical protein
MLCPTEFAQAQFADGELPECQAKELIAHLHVCAVCRERVAALKAENRLLAQSLRSNSWWETEQEPLEPEVPEPAKIGHLAAIFIGAAILLRMGFSLILSMEPPSGLDWLNPLSMSGQLNWLSNGIFYIFREGSSMMTSLVNELSSALLCLLILGCLAAVTRRAKGITPIIGLIALMFAFVMPGYSIEIRKPGKGSGGVSVAPNETVNDTLVALGDSVNVRGTITGDLIAFARQISIQGTVQGNVIAFAQRIDITGNVGGDIFGFGQSIQANGHVGGSLWGFAQTPAVGLGGKLEQDATLFGSNISVDGDVGRDLTTFGAILDVGGVIGRDVRFRGAQLLVRAPSRVGRNLDARVGSEKGVQIDPGVTITGNRKVELEAPKPNRYLTFGFYTSQLLRIGAAFLMGLLLFWLLPAAGRVSFSNGRSLLTSGGIGFLAAVATPVAVLIAAITLIGIPIALVMLALWLLGLYLAKIIVAKFIGCAILGRKDETMPSTALALLLGLVVAIVAINLPFIGGVLNFLLMLVGLGALAMTIYKMWALPLKTQQNSDTAI